MNLILTFVSAFFVFLIGILPFRVLYIFSDIMFYVLYFSGYRKTVVRGNLERCFPDLSKKEMDRMVKLSYKNLTDVIVEGFKAFTMTSKQIVARHKVMNPEVLNQFLNNGRSVITTPCHYGNWEWGSMSPSLQFEEPVVVFYKPLSNKYVDRFVRKNRSRTGSSLESIYRTARVFKENENRTVGYIMAADQSPSNAKKAIWVDFLKQDTAFLHGPEAHAKRNNLPVVFVDIQRVKRGFYELELSVISDESKETADGEITTAYAKKLEAAILKKPENWLWSHRRWKISRDK